MSISFLNPMRAWRTRQLLKALEDYESSPGILETASVVRLFLKCGDYKQAFMYADNGYQRFPSSSRLLEYRQQALKEKSLQECKLLRRKNARSPRPETVAKIIEIHRSLGEFAACEKMSRKWADRFPGSWLLQFSIGKYLFQRSLIEKDPQASTRCLEQLERAANLNPENYKTQLYLATLLYQLGSASQALATVERLLQGHPDDPRAVSLKRCIQSTPITAPIAVEAPTPSQDTGDGDDNLAELRANPAVHGALVHQSSGGEFKVFEKYFSDAGTFCFDNAETAFAELVHSLTVSSNRMGIGDLKSCMLEGGSWRVFYKAHAHRSLVLCSTKDFEEDDFVSVAKKISPEGVMAG